MTFQVQAIEDAVKADQVTRIVNQWLDRHPNVKSNGQARNFISNYVVKACNGDFTNPKNFDDALSVRLKFEELAKQIVKWFENPPIPYFSQSQRNWATATRWLHLQETVILGIAAWQDFVLKHEYDEGFWDWDISTEELIKLIHNARSPYLEYGRVDAHLRPVSGLLVQKFGKAAVDQAFDRFSGNIKKTAEARYSARTTAEWREAESQKEKEQKERFHDPKTLIGRLQHERVERETRNIASQWSAGRNHAATARGRDQLNAIIDSGVEAGKSWFEIHDEVQAEANRLAGL